jgi:hypothetical protein
MFNLINAVKQTFVRQPTFEEELAFIEAEWLAEFTDEEVEQLCEDGWDDIGYAAEPPKKLNSEEEYMDAMEAQHEEQYLKWLAEPEIVDGGAA